MSKSNSFPYLLLFPFALTLFVAPQIGAAQTMEDAFPMAEKCSGPLGALLPDCQAAKTSLDIPAAARRSPSQGATPSPAQLPGSGTAGDASRTEHQKAADLPPQPPTEFQRFVASSVGELLPVFGASLFARMPSTFAPLDRVPVTADYILGPGDQVLLRVWGQVSLDLDLPIMEWVRGRQGIVADFLWNSFDGVEEQSVSPLDPSYRSVAHSWWNKQSEDGPFRYGVRPFRTNPYVYFGWRIKSWDRVLLLGDARYYCGNFRDQRFELALSAPITRDLSLELGTSCAFGTDPFE